RIPAVGCGADCGGRAPQPGSVGAARGSAAGGAAADGGGAMSRAIVTRDLTPQRWPAFEELFGKNGACAGCWCMWWRLLPGERISLANGPSMKARQKKLVQTGRSRGVLAFIGDEPVGFCMVARRRDLPKLQR